MIKANTLGYHLQHLPAHHIPLSPTGRPPISPRVIIGALIIKHLDDLDDRDTIEQISENIYMQYFLGYRDHGCHGLSTEYCLSNGFESIE